MSKYIMRLDDACERRDVEKWERIEQLLDKYQIRPLVGVIPCCKDPQMDKYEADMGFWSKVEKWQQKGWIIALHGFEHIYTTYAGGLNPVNQFTEFAGLPLEDQCEKIKRGVEIFHEHGIDPLVFFAPAHTFDKNTIQALLQCSNIRIISDTVANKPYNKLGITFIPQQSGAVRQLPFNMVTFCYHPNTMDDLSYQKLDSFLKKHKHSFTPFPLLHTRRKENVYDFFLRKLYFLMRQRRRGL